MPAPPAHRGGAGYAGAASAGLALGLTELFAGLLGRVPSALASVGSVIVDRSPTFVVEMAISVFGTADKGALAIATAITVVLLGAWVGIATVKRRWIAPTAFGGAALLAVPAALDQLNVAPLVTVVLLLIAAISGVVVLRALLRPIEQPEVPTDSLSGDPSRRRFIAGVAGTGVAAAVAGLGGRSLIIRRSEQARSSVAIPAVDAAAPALSPGTFFDIPGLEKIVVPNKDFYRIDTALIVPSIDPDTWSMKVTGLVDNPLELTLGDLLGMSLREEFVTISCVSNEVGGDLVGNALWTGVRLSEVLDMAGVSAGATQIVGRSVDGWTAGFPTELVFDGREPLIAIGMNNEPLPPNHGFPARLIVPGIYGYVSATKWLEEIELTTWEAFDGYWITRGWAKNGPIKTQSRIDVPRRGELVNGKPAVIAGVAWAPLKGIERVEVSVDEGEWIEAEVTTPLSHKAWVQWKAEVEVSSGEHAAQVRATDGTGTTQTETRQNPFPEGATGWDAVRFKAS